MMYDHYPFHENHEEEIRLLHLTQIQGICVINLPSLP